MIVYLFIGFPIILTSLLIILRATTELFSRSRIYPPDEVPPLPVAIVFGAGLRRDGQPTLVLRDRVAMAAQLYQSGKVKKLLMSGDNRFVDYNEPQAMGEYARALGIPAEDIVLDFAGRSTYETCYRAKAIFGVQEAILITQRFHLPRAIYTCSMLGLRAVGVAADWHPYRRRAILFWQLREMFATLNAFWEVHIHRPLPVLGEPEPIFQEKTP
jgi:SanA protein